MTATTWFLVKYIEDPFRNEPRNVGVVVTQPGSGVARFLAERDGTLDGRRVGSAVSSTRAYRAWIDFVRHHLSEGTFEEQVDRLNLRAVTNYQIEKRGVLLGQPGADDLKAVAEELFREVVRDEAEDRPPTLDDLADKILFHQIPPDTSSKIARNVKYTVDIRGIPTELDFDYQHAGTKITVVERVKLNDRERSTSKRVNDFLYRMEHAKESNVVDRFLALYDIGSGPDAGRSEKHLQAIEKLSYTVNARTESAPAAVSDFLAAA